MHAFTELEKKMQIIVFHTLFCKKEKNDIETYLQQKIMKMLTFIILRIWWNKSRRDDEMFLNVFLLWFDLLE